jgi:hypothetical protein
MAGSRILATRSPMRRLASQDRDDSYNSRRDYQELTSARGIEFRPVRHGANKLVFPLMSGAGSQASELLALGGFVAPSDAVRVRVAVEDSSNRRERIFDLGATWNRLGVAARLASPVIATVEWSGNIGLSFWGLAGGVVELPPSLADRRLADSEVMRDHLMPETFYFPDEAAVEVEVDDERSSRFSMADGASIILKKCSYCGRLLPVDPARPGALSFHKHKAKRTGHQNECRACKKWRINDAFNPLRTVDQLHESSVITRERKLFLREPEILQELKDRTGAGLKSQVWERFGRRCFYCKRDLTLDEVQLDHTRPLAYLWPIDVHATCLCADHNNQKSDKFPVDFYSLPQLRELAAIIGLPLDTLREKTINEVELRRIVADPTMFAREWGARHFVSTARRISELRPDVDLFALLLGESPTIHALVVAEVGSRPEPVSTHQ